MEYKKYELDNIDVHFIKTNKFKSIYISLVLINEFKKENLTKNIVLRKLLTTSSKKLKNEVEVTKKVCDLYNSGICITNTSLSNVITTTIDMEVLEDKYTEEGLLKNALENFFDTIFNPNVVDDEFEQSNYKIVIDSVKDYYEKEKENKVRYANNKAYSLMDEEYLKYNNNGYKEDLENITSKVMKDYYDNLIKTANASIFIIGNVNEEEILNIIDKNIEGKLIKNNNPYKNMEFKELPTIKKSEDTENNNQSILIMIYKILNITKKERNVILPIFNRIFGVGTNSKLFKNVREKNSLCYDIRSSVLRPESIMTVQSGISYENKDKVIELIEKELDNMKKGNITKEELEEAINFRKKNLLNFEDYNDVILQIKQSSVLFGNDDLKERKTHINEVTLDDVIALANKIELNVEYILKGEKNE